MTPEPQPPAGRGRRIAGGIALFVFVIGPVAFFSGTTAIVSWPWLGLVVPLVVAAVSVVAVWRYLGRDVLLGCVIAGAVSVILFGVCIYLLTQALEA